tara:strand:- start:234 stop:494 length:261 start_codon:yes stop_codon:yes gene_type:complete
MSIDKANKIVEAINEIEPDREYSFNGENLDSIIWHDIATKSAISKEDIEAKITELEEQDSDKKASGKQKLKDLGLDDDEIKALTGA